MKLNNEAKQNIGAGILIAIIYITSLIIFPSLVQAQTQEQETDAIPQELSNIVWLSFIAIAILSVFAFWPLGNPIPMNIRIILMAIIVILIFIVILSMDWYGSEEPQFCLTTGGIIALPLMAVGLATYTGKRGREKCP